MGQMTDVVSDHEEDKGEEDDDIKILETRLQESKRAQVEQICYIGITIII